MCWVPPHPPSPSSFSHSLCGLLSLNTLPKHKMIDVLRSVTRQDFYYFSCHKISRLLLCPLCREVGKYNQDYFIPLVPLSPHSLKRRKCFCSISCLEGILFSWNEVRPPQFHRWSSGMAMLAACEGQECIGKLSSMFSQEWMESELYRAKMLPGSLFICLLLVVSLVGYILFVCLLASPPVIQADLKIVSWTPKCLNYPGVPPRTAHVLGLMRCPLEEHGVLATGNMCSYSFRAMF